MKKPIVAQNTPAVGVLSAETFLINYNNMSNGLIGRNATGWDVDFDAHERWKRIRKEGTDVTGEIVMLLPGTSDENFNVFILTPDGKLHRRYWDMLEVHPVIVPQRAPTA